MNWLRLLLWLVGSFLAFVIVVNVFLYVYSENSESSLIFVTEDTTYIFAHGNYVCDSGLNSSFHRTRIGSEQYRTLDVINSFNNTRVWLSMCEQGNSDSIASMGDLSILWPENVDRVERPGNVYPIFWGFGFTRVVVGGRDFEHKCYFS